MEVVSANSTSLSTTTHQFGIDGLIVILVILCLHLFVRHKLECPVRDPKYAGYKSLESSIKIKKMFLLM